MFCNLQPRVETAASNSTGGVLGRASLSVAAGTWGPRAFLSIVDQGIVSGASFVLSLVLARVLDPLQYGAFSLAFALFLFMAGFQNALILEPMAVLGPTSRDQTGREYLVSMARINMVVAGWCSLLLAISAAATASHRDVSTALIGLALSAPFILLHWFLRRACYIQTRPGLALEGSALYALSVLAGTWTLVWGDRASPFSVFVIVGLSSASAGFRICLGLGLSSKGFRLSIRRDKDRRLFLTHWAYGKWSMATTAVYWGAGNMYVPILALTLGLRAVASVRAIENLFLPMGQVLTALGTLLLPQAAVFARTRHPRNVRALGVQLSMAMSLGTLAYCAAILAMGSRVLTILYGHRPYSTFAYLIPFFCALVLIRAVTDLGPATMVRAMGRPDVGFWACAAGTAANVTIGLLLVHQFGVVGALSGWVLSALLQAVVVSYFFIRITR